MADKSKDTNTSPLHQFHFNAEISNLGKLRCKEVSGLDTEFEVIEYRTDNTPTIPHIDMPSLQKRGEVTLRKNNTQKRYATLGLDK